MITRAARGAAAAETADLNSAADRSFVIAEGCRILVMDDDDGPAVAAATNAGIAIVRLSVPDDAKAGMFALTAETTGSADTAAPNSTDRAVAHCPVIWTRVALC